MVITPNVNFAAGETCTVTIFKDQVHDVDTDDSVPDTDTLPADYVWSFTVATGDRAAVSADVHLTMGNPSGAIADINVAEQLPDGEAGVRAVVQPRSRARRTG